MKRKVDAGGDVNLGRGEDNYTEREKDRGEGNAADGELSSSPGVGLRRKGKRSWDRGTRTNR